MADNTERAMYLQAVAKVKQEEGNFVKGAAVGVVASVPRAFGALTDLFGITEGAEKDIRNAWEDKLDTTQPGTKAGYDFGSVFGDAGQMVLDPLAGTSKLAVGAASKAGLMLGLADKTGAIKPEWSTHAVEATAAFQNKTKTAMQVWKDHGLVNLNYGVKNAPIELARYFGLQDLRVADGAVIDASGMESRLSDVLYNSTNGMPISSVLTGTKLFDDSEYRWLFDRSAGGQGYKLKLEDMAPHKLGYHSPKEGIIVINKKLFDSKLGQFTDTGIRTLAHEIQHAIQLGEDWVGKGNNKIVASQQVASVENAIKTRLQKAQSIAVEKTKKIYEKYYWPLIEEAQKRRALYDDLPKAKDVPDSEYGQYLQDRARLLNESYAVEHKVSELLESSPFAKARQHLSSIGIELPLSFTPTNIMRLDKDFSALKAETPKIPYDAVFTFYENDIGEVWARVADKTQYVTEADMASRAPWRFMERTSPNIQSSRHRRDVGFYGELLDEEKDIQVRKLGIDPNKITP